MLVLPIREPPLASSPPLPFALLFVNMQTVVFILLAQLVYILDFPSMTRAVPTLTFGTADTVTHQRHSHHAASQQSSHTSQPPAHATRTRTRPMPTQAFLGFLTEAQRTKFIHDHLGLRRDMKKCLTNVDIGYRPVSSVNSRTPFLQELSNVHLTASASASDSTNDAADIFDVLGSSLSDTSTEKYSEDPAARYLSNRYHNMITFGDLSLRTLHPNLVVLAMDPSIMMRLDHFVNFVKTNIPRNQRSDPWAVRQAYSDSLGHVISYRGMLVEGNEMWQQLVTNGIDCSAVALRKDGAGSRGVLGSTGILDSEEDPTTTQCTIQQPPVWPESLSSPLHTVADNHHRRCGNPWDDVFISSSDRKEIALASTVLQYAFNVAPKMTRFNRQQANKIVLLRLRVPVLDSVDYTNQVKEWKWWWTDRRRKAYERFILWSIPPEEILGAEIFHFPKGRREKGRMVTRLVDEYFESLGWFPSMMLKPDMRSFVEWLQDGEEAP